MKQFSAKILTNVPICDNFFELTLSPESEHAVPAPGQFLTIRVDSITSPLLRRPFAYSGFDKKNGNFSIIYQKRGKATEILSGKRSGESVDCIGPIGTSFKITDIKETAVLVAGGIGVGPIQFLASELKEQNRPYIFVFGARNKNIVPQNEAFTKLNPAICTDDGSSGCKGTSVDYLKTVKTPQNPVMYACGPHPMLHACYDFATNHNCQCWISVEQVMACGVGACMGCVVKVRSPQKFARACKEGPVFNGNELDWS